ncbi:hypothetical protein CORC01_03785 [Colletotrichum orchidophilum]|uniref:Uncharacterized protein n=1 Tax=Colletotrichum orchidophilum TaxID=1209926 RepID=A0A1G4BI49_9PEZI|nr:uncharacterized protein CORC01_03785 [Colletotrichum orchidophilum]OHF00957.1 hypothetical protein CORC01_03785 [Colletotrichum orchidophilum]
MRLAAPVDRKKWLGREQGRSSSEFTQEVNAPRMLEPWGRRPSGGGVTGVSSPVAEEAVMKNGRAKKNLREEKTPDPHCCSVIPPW